MTLILRPRRKRTCCHWLQEKDGKAVAIGSSFVHTLPRDCTEFESLDAVTQERPDVAQLVAKSTAKIKHHTKWGEHDLSRVYAMKIAAVNEFDNFGEVSQIIIREAEVRGITTNAMIQMIREKAFASQQQVNDEIERITEKLTLPD